MKDEEKAELKLKNEKLYRTLDHLRENKNRKQKKIEEMQEGEVARFVCWNNRLTELEKENAELKKENAELKKENAELKKENAESKERIEELEKQLVR